MKKKGLVLLSLVAVSLVLMACSNKDNKTAVSGEEEATTKIVSTEMGDVEVPVNPQRVLVNWYIGDALTLDLNVVGYSGWAHKAMPFYDQLKEIPQIEKWEKEELLSYEPDLIITYSKEDFENLSKIAPVVVISEGEGNSTDRLTKLGEITGREREAKKAVDLFETKLAAAKDKFSTDAFKDKTFSVFEDWGPDSFGVYYETGSRGAALLYDYIGLKKPAKLEELIAKEGEGRGGLSYEVAADYFGDYIIWFSQEDGQDQPIESEYKKTKIWDTIPAVKAGNVTDVPGRLVGLFFYADVTSLTAQLDYFVENLNVE